MLPLPRRCFGCGRFLRFCICGPIIVDTFYAPPPVIITATHHEHYDINNTHVHRESHSHSGNDHGGYIEQHGESSNQLQGVEVAQGYPTAEEAFEAEMRKGKQKNRKYENELKEQEKIADAHRKRQAEEAQRR